MTPFLEVLTRCYKRPNLLVANQASLTRQTDPDWIQTLLIDDVGRGIPWSHENMAAYAPRLTGEYIWMLDDDDLCIHPALVADLKRIALACNPDVIFLRMDHGFGAILPDGRWGQQPVECGIGSSAYVVQREVWQAHAGAMIPGRYASDFDLISSIWQAGVSTYWHDVIASRVQRQSLGQPE